MSDETAGAIRIRNREADVTGLGYGDRDGRRPKPHRPAGTACTVRSRFEESRPTPDTDGGRPAAEMETG